MAEKRANYFRVSVIKSQLAQLCDYDIRSVKTNAGSRI